MEISFIIPYYEVTPRLLRRCLESVCAFMQAVPDCEWEAWVVDDGSVAHAEAARQEVERTGAGQMHLLRVKHGGLGAARNAGLERVSGEYVFFLDADDYLFAGSALPLWSCCRQRRPDILAFGMQSVHTVETERPSGPLRLRVTYEGSGAGFMVSHNLHAAAWSYLFRRDILGSLRFVEGIFHEDEAFTPRLWLRAQKVCVTTLPVYAYYQRQDSIVHVPGREQLARRMADLQQVLVGLRNEQPDNSLQRLALQRRVDTLASDVWWRLVCESPDTDFLRSQLQCLREAGFYPLPWHPYTVRYLLMYMGAQCWSLSVALHKAGRLKQKLSSKNQ